MFSQYRYIYEKLQDELSKNIYNYRSLYNLTHNSEYIRGLVKTAPYGKMFLEELNNALARKKNICIFGAGALGKSIKTNYPDINPLCFIDNKNFGYCLDGIPVVNFEEWQNNFKDSVIIISPKFYHKEILKQLLEVGVDRGNIINAGEYSEKDGIVQYFDLPDLVPEKEEVFLDCGAYDGLNSKIFVEWASRGGRAKKVIAFELDPENRNKCNVMLDQTGCEYKLFPVGLWNKRDTLYFTGNSRESAHISQDNLLTNLIAEGEVDTIDNLVNEKVTFLKMDIEGAELEALQGAEKLIKTYKPKLAISIYHKPEDIYMLPSLLLSYVPEYKFWLRHYSLRNVDTVLYGIV